MEPISSDFLKEVSGEFDLELIFKLDLTSYGKSNPSPIVVENLISFFQASQNWALFHSAKTLSG